MDSKTAIKAETMAAPAFFIRVASQVGPNDNIEMSFGLPSDMCVTDMNAYVDKALLVVEHQNTKNLLVQAKRVLQADELSLLAQRQHRADFEASCARSWDHRNRGGPFKMNESQRSQLSNFDKTISELTEERIPKSRKQVEELERKLNEGV